MPLLALALAFVTGAVAADVTAAEPAVAAKDAPPLAAAMPAAPKPLADVELLEFLGEFGASEAGFTDPFALDPAVNARAANALDKATRTATPTPPPPAAEQEDDHAH